MKNFRLFFKLFFIFTVLAAGLGGCTTYNAATGRQEFIAISASEEISMGKNLHEDILKENKLSTDEVLVNRVERIGRKLAQVSDRQDIVYQFYVIDKDDLNAFTIPGGNVYIYAGLIDKLATDGQIAFVLGHEIGHGAAKHTVKKFQAALGYNLIGSIILSQLDIEDGAKKIAALGSNVAMSIVFSAYGRQDEFESDRLGIKYMYLAGYDPQEAVASLAVLKKEEKKGSKIPLILRSHPYLDDRIVGVKKEAALVSQKYQ